jgi:hypothetical protein
MRCQLCDRPLADNEPVYRVAVGFGTTWYNRFGSCIGSLCTSCALKEHEYRSVEGRLLSTPIFYDQRWQPPEPCRHCGRPVFLNNRRKKPRHIVCGMECRNAVYYASAHRMPKSSTQGCLFCGNQFSTRRSDARYCSSACRQKSYRQRTRSDAR